MYIKPFQPKSGGTVVIANAVAASTPALLDEGCDQVALYNSSATATAFWRCQAITQTGDTMANASATTDMPIPPDAQVRITVGMGLKKFSVIASAADGNLYITPGKGN